MTSPEAQVCRRTIEKHSKSFALASRLLPPACRDDAVVLYAWCRSADDAVDMASPEDQSCAIERPALNSGVNLRRTRNCFLMRFDTDMGHSWRLYAPSGVSTKLGELQSSRRSRRSFAGPETEWRKAR